MIRLVFTYDKEVLIFDIDNRTILYRDRKWPQGVKFIPRDEGFVKKIMMSRNRISNNMITWINDSNSGKSLEEFNACVDDAAIAEVVKKDARLKGCIFRKAFTGEELAAAEKSEEKGGSAGYVNTIPYNNSNEEVK
jgi:hypothetical protein